MRKVVLSLLAAGAFISAPVLAMNHSLNAGVSVEYELPVNAPEVFTNFTFFKVHAICKIQTQDESNVIHIKALNRSGQVNGQVINTGDELDLTLHNGETIDLVAESAAQVELTNKGEHLIKAKCQIN
ncbi:Uncharacterised protein [Legionella beliardensis]|uniref:Transmembrane protein n=1 Tax=Legionella beliardensis TaxID=91822 RepID=A0A378I7N4_9GAMM|nr:hypothetical protein [Legionella beliardensis]STX28414.1 Uncharacterised protein [Legionella beliardensis]